MKEIKTDVNENKTKRRKRIISNEASKLFDEGTLLEIYSEINPIYFAIYLKQSLMPSIFFDTSFTFIHFIVIDVVYFVVFFSLSLCFFIFIFFFFFSFGLFGLSFMWHLCFSFFEYFGQFFKTNVFLFKLCGVFHV